MTEALSLNVLLARPLLSLTRAYERTDREAPPLPFYANLLRVLDDRGVDIRELPALARVSKRAVATMTKSAFVEVDGSPKLARLTPAGEKAKARAAANVAAAELEWAAAIGDGRVINLRTALETLVAQFELEHPHYVITYGTADVSAIGGNFPRHGTDWKPVHRIGRDSAAGLPLTALLSQALMDFTIRYESGFVWALSSTVHALLKFPDEGLLLREAPKEAGITGAGKSLLERHVVVDVDDGGGDRQQRRVTLSMRGKFARDAYAGDVARVEREWRQAYGDEPVDALRAALEAIATELEPGLADHPLMTWMPDLYESSG
jgi:hypothetical protein